MSDSSNEVPIGWKRLRLDQIGRIVGGSTPSTENSEFWDGNIAWTTPKDLSNLEGPYLEDSSRKITEAGLQSCASEVLPPGSVLFSSRAPIGLVAINRIPMATNQGFKSFVLHSDVADAKYLYHWLRSNRSYLESLGNGATFKEVSKTIVARVEIALPPLAEQKRLAAILDHADGIRRKRQQALRLVDDFLRSVFLDMFGDPVENAKGWELKSLNRLGRVITGNTPPSTLEGAFGGDIPFVTPGDLNESWTSSKRTLTQLGATRARLVRRGTTLVCCIGTIGKMGKTIRQSAFNQQINAVEWADEWMDAYGLECLKFFKNAIAAAGTSTTLPILNKSSFERFEIPVPPRPICLDFSTIVNQMDAIKTVLERSALETNDLFQSLQHRAFSGQL